MIGNRDSCRGLAEQFRVDWHHIGDAEARPDNDRLVALFDRYEVDYIVLARYMRILPAAVCWQFAGGRILNLHHGLLPSFPGATPYKDAYEHRMLTYGATVHFIVPELGRGQPDRPSGDVHRPAGNPAGGNPAIGAKRSTSRPSWSRACAASSTARWSCTSTASSRTKKPPA